MKCKSATRRCCSSARTMNRRAIDKNIPTRHRRQGQPEKLLFRPGKLAGDRCGPTGCRPAVKLVHLPGKLARASTEDMAAKRSRPTKGNCESYMKALPHAFPGVALKG